MPFGMDEPAVVKRLARLDLIFTASRPVVLLATGLARLYFTGEGAVWYVLQPLFHVKMTLFVLMGAAVHQAHAHPSAAGSRP